MTYEEIFTQAKEAFTGGDITGYKGDFAIQVNITGEGEGRIFSRTLFLLHLSTVLSLPATMM